jgi:hypothetical protein
MRHRKPTRLERLRTELNRRMNEHEAHCRATRGPGWTTNAEEDSFIVANSYLLGEILTLEERAKRKAGA